MLQLVNKRIWWHQAARYNCVKTFGKFSWRLWPLRSPFSSSHWRLTHRSSRFVNVGRRGATPEITGTSGLSTVRDNLKFCRNFTTSTALLLTPQGGGSHLPQTPDLASRNFFSSPRMKSQLGGRGFVSRPSVKSRKYRASSYTHVPKY